MQLEDSISISPTANPCEMSQASFEDQRASEFKSLLVIIRPHPPTIPLSGIEATTKELRNSDETSFDAA